MEQIGYPHYFRSERTGQAPIQCSRGELSKPQVLVIKWRNIPIAPTTGFRVQSGYNNRIKSPQVE